MRGRTGLGAVVVLVAALAWALTLHRPARAGIVARGAAAAGASDEVVAEPHAGVAPFLGMIASARHSIELTMYELYDPRVEHALVAAAHRGVDVRVALNGGYYSERESTNAAAARVLAAGGAHVRFTPTYFALTHQKTLTVDGAESAIMTLNFDGLYSSTRDFAVLDRDRADVAAIVSAFDADWARRRVIASRGSGDLVWSPGAAATVVAMITSARHSIALEDEEMAYGPATSALCAAARRHVRVTVVMTDDTDWRDDFDELARCGVDVRVFHGQGYYIHAKVLVVDGAAALVSSQNLSTTSLQDNRELGIRLTARPLVQALGADVTADATRGERWTP